MSDTAAAPSPLSEPIRPPAIEVREVWPWALLALALTLLLYLVGVEQGATSVVPGQVLHEWVHDGRHLLGFPCH
ncbi:CbtB-domain containing protein [soil metagenome]|jgi:cobalt transporter subunit CbtB|nr:CbtB-domain containing protein [Thermoleophilaceae bacterium]MDQ3240750.1 CbtB-domain containing protein [Actinomycetota bacterium]MDQ3320441.1 CbtB-domain containing protein [Actinomycetota bacterium]